jgi:hypothetical protein
VADLGTAATAKATVWIEWDTPEGLNVAVLTESGGEVAGDDADPGEDEVVSFDVENGKLYEVRVGGFVNVSTAYRGYLWARSTSGRSFSGPGNLVYPRTTAPTNVASSQKKAEAAIAVAVAELTGGRYLAAVTAARAAVTASNTVLRVAVKATR